MSGLLKKFNNFQLQSPLNIHSELSSEDQLNNDGYIYTKSAELPENGISSYQKMDRRQPQMLYQQYDFLGGNRRIDKPATAQVFEDQDGWVLFPNQASSKSKVFNNFHGKQHQNDVDHFLAGNSNPIMELPQEDTVPRDLFDF